MRFDGFKLPRFVMYNGWLIGLGMMLGCIILYPLALGKGFSLFKTAIYDMFFRDFKLTVLFSFVTFVPMQIAGYDCSRTKPKFIEVLEEEIIIHLLSGKVHEFKYSDLSSLEYTNDIYKIFLFTFKDGGKQKISNSVKNSELAFAMIRQKIQESNK